MTGMAGNTENNGANSNSSQSVHLDDRVELEFRTVGAETHLTVNHTASAENNIATSTSYVSDAVTLNIPNVIGPSQFAEGAVTLRVLPGFQNREFVEEALQELNDNDFLDALYNYQENVFIFHDNAGNNGAIAFPVPLLEVEATPNMWSVEHLRINIDNASAENNSATSTSNVSNVVTQNTSNANGLSQFTEGAVALRVLPAYQNDDYLEEALQELDNSGILDGGYEWYSGTTVDLGDPASGRIRPVNDDDSSGYISGSP